MANKNHEYQKPLGTQLIIEFSGCDKEILDDTEAIKSILLNAAVAAKATIVDHCFHKFSPVGVSGVVIIAESHITIHTWPEHGYCAIDIFTCGDLLNNNHALKVLKEGLNSQQEKVFRIERGLKNLMIDSLSATLENR
ncbi:MAG: adenosylmethionine decarboxylase [Deltaproteobacteria bacterium]|nr:adenosylmethionine decarboxylase [Deltaproteobacteria bacterium]